VTTATTAYADTHSTPTPYGDVTVISRPPSISTDGNLSFPLIEDNSAHEPHDDYDLTDCVSVPLRLRHRRAAAENAMSGIAAALGMELDIGMDYTDAGGVVGTAGVGSASASGPVSLFIAGEGGMITGTESGSEYDDSEWVPAEELDERMIGGATNGRKGRQTVHHGSNESTRGSRALPPDQQQVIICRRSYKPSASKSKILHSCPLCKETFSRRADCDRHLEFFHNSRDIVRSQKFVCARCSYAFCREDARRRHLMNGCSGRIRKQRARSARDG
jgi:hypothetical protein